MGKQAKAPAEEKTPDTKESSGMQIGYLEFVTPTVDEFCATYEKVHGVSFSDPVAELGNARTAPLAGGGKVGVRGPMRPDEKPVVRPYLATKDIQAAVEAAKTTGAEIAFPPMKLGDHGTFAIFIQGGIESALWQE